MVIWKDYVLYAIHIKNECFNIFNIHSDTLLLHHVSNTRVNYLIYLFKWYIKLDPFFWGTSENVLKVEWARLVNLDVKYGGELPMVKVL